MKVVTDIKFSTQEVWYCRSHSRRADHFNKNGDRRCDPNKGGILLPCLVEKLSILTVIVTKQQVVVDDAGSIIGLGSPEIEESVHL